MILLQAAIGAGIFLFTLFIIFFAIGIPLFTGMIMKSWNKKKRSYIELNDPLAKPNQKKTIDWGLLFAAVIISIFIVVALFLILIFILSLFYPSIE